jgi:hypothetical protein
MPGHDLLSPYWIEATSGSLKGFGVTAYSADDAFQLLADANLPMDSGPPKIREVGFDELDNNHVVPNMGVISRRGVWYPNLNS